MLKNAIGINSLLLGFFAAVTASLLGYTFSITEDKIAESERRAAQKALYEIISVDRHDNDLLNDTFVIPDKLKQELGLKGEQFIHIARRNNQPVAVIIPSVAPHGYSGDIKLITGINLDGTVAGVRVLAHKETPGLGDKVELKKSDWILGFNGKSLQNPKSKFWNVKKQGGVFDQFTGATITPRAVIKRVHKTLREFRKHRAEILSEPDNRPRKHARKANKG